MYRADNTLEFAEAAEAIAKHADLHGPRFIIKEHCDGPEVDVNLVLSEGEILFSQVCDEQPKLGDGTLEEKALGFTESGVMWHSNLPSSEQNLIRSRPAPEAFAAGTSLRCTPFEARFKVSLKLC